MWYKNVAGRLFGLVTKHACDGQTDGQNYDSQDRASIARMVKRIVIYGKIRLHIASTQHIQQCHLGAINADDAVQVPSTVMVVRHTDSFSTQRQPFLLCVRINVENMCLCRKYRQLTKNTVYHAIS